jgi:hypothetical protein
MEYQMSDELEEQLSQLLADLEDLSDEELVECRQVIKERIEFCLEILK